MNSPSTMMKGYCYASNVIYMYAWDAEGKMETTIPSSVPFSTMIRLNELETTTRSMRISP